MPKPTKNIEAIYPLSPMQEGMLFHTLYAPESGVYFDQFSFILQGSLNIAAFKHAWQRVVARHAILRTLFVWENRNKPLQIVRKQVELPWYEQDWRELTSTEQQTQLTRFLQEDKKQGFALNQAPLMRCTLIRLTAETYQLVWSNHHLLIDGWCLPIIFKELFAYYEAISQGTEFFLERPIPYQDYIVWLQQQDMTKAEQFWQRKLNGFFAPTPLRVERSGTQTDQDRVIGFGNEARIPETREQIVRCFGNEARIPETLMRLEQDMTLSSATTEALQQLARQYRLTLNTLVQGAWALLLSRYSGENDVVFGATVSGRQIPLAGVESMVGLFINTLPVRVFMTEDIALIPWLQQLQLQQVETEQYSYTPLVDIQSWSDISPGSPLFEHILVFENYPGDVSLQQVSRHLTISNVQSFEQTNYPLTVIGMLGQTLSLRISYDTARFEAATIARMLGHLQTLLEGMVAQPEQNITELPLLTETEQHQLLIEWNATAVDYPVEQCVHQLFEAQVETTPEAVAVEFQDQQLTYRALNQRANQLAHHLQTLGVGPDRLVGLCLERSLELIIGLLGILKANGAYVPIDPTYPKARLAFMLEDAQIRWLLTQEKLVPNLPEHQAQVLCLEADWTTLSHERVDNLVNQLLPDQLAYVIYTSGSTGKPKGTMLTHRGLVNYLSWCVKTYAVAEGQGAPVQSSIGFDATITSLYSPLLVGKTVVLLPEPQELEGLSTALIEGRHFSLVKLTPAHLEVLSQLLPGKNVANQTNALIIGGEALTMSHISFWQTHAPQTRLFNEYGPTESVVGCCVYEVPSSKTLSPVPIGRPIANTQLYILAANLQLTPIGVPGELHIGGVGLAQGYLNRPDLTAEKFIPNPFSDGAESRLYKTGDLARYLPDGNLEYLGRLDNQIKIRGFRIELGEIETVLAQHIAVQESVVIVHTDASNDQRLVAYLVPNQETVIEKDIDTTELRHFLKERLPNYMIPSAFVLVETMPLTPNGKIDRRALSQLSVTRLKLEVGFVAPRTPEEELLASIWASVLKIEKVGIHDNFFELGGHSLLATQVFSRVRDTFSIEFPLRNLFESPTIAELSQQIEVARRENQNLLVAPPIKPIDREGSLPLSFAQERLWFLDQLQPNSSSYNVPIALRLTGSLNIAALEQSLAEIVHRHEILRTTFSTAVASAPIQVIHPFSVINYQLSAVNLQQLSPEAQAIEVLRLATFEAQRSFDLQRGPLFRTSLLQLQYEESVLFLSCHHIVTDGWSINVLFRELSTLYEAFSTGAPSPLPPLSIQYVDFAHWQRQWLTGDVLETQLNYWQQQLTDVPAQLALPIDRPRPQIQTSHGDTQTLKISQALAQQLKSLSQQSGTTLFMTLLAAFATLLRHYSGQQNIIIGTPIANRNRSEIESLLGFFVNTLALRFYFSDNPSFQQLLTRTRKVCLDAYTYQDLPFEKLIETLQIERNLSVPPLIQAAFAFQNRESFFIELPKLNIRPLDVDDIKIAKTDLTLFVDDESDGLLGMMEYNTDLFETTTIVRMLADFQKVLEAIISKPNSPLLQLLPSLGLMEPKLTTTFSPEKEVDVFTELREYSNLTANQLLIWLGHQLNPDKPIYNNVVSFTIATSIDVVAFQTAFQTLVNSSDALRSVFEDQNGIPQLKVVAHFPYNVEYLDFSATSVPDTEFQTWIQQRCQKPFKVDNCLFDSVLIKMSPAQFVWYLNTHQLISDGLSLALILNRLSTFYGLSLQAQLDKVVKWPQFQPYIDYDHEYQGSARYIKAKDYWQQRFAESQEPMTFYGKMPNKRTTNVQRHTIKLGIERTQKLKAISGSENTHFNQTGHALIFNIYLAILATYLYRISGNQRLSIGVPLHNRRLKSHKETIGSFMQVLPLHIEITADETFQSLINQMAKTAFEGFRYGQYAIRNPPQQPVYEVMLNYHTVSFLTFHETPVMVDWYHTGHGNDSLDIQIHDAASSDNFTMNFDFHCDVFEEKQRPLAIQHFLKVLDACLEDSSQSVHQVNLLSVEEQRLLVEFNQTQDVYPQDHCIHQLFEAQVERTPEAIAVIFKDQSVTYRELNHKANQVAHYLCSLGVKPEILVGICIERSVEMIIGLLGILKAGGAYLPLDPAYPVVRIAFMLADAGVGVLLTQSSLVNELSETTTVRMICLDAEQEALSQLNTDNLSSRVRAENLAYVIYTSGSTGKPKGVMIQHQSLVNFINTALIKYELTQDDCLLQFASISFDAAAEEIYPCLVGGGHLVLRFDEMLNSVSKFLQHCRDLGVTVLDLPTAFWHQVTDELATSNVKLPEALRLVIIGGERALSERVGLWQQWVGNRPLLVNTYGPTEATVVATMYQLPYSEVLNRQWQNFPIGRAISNAQTYIFDKYLQPVPIGVPGELHLGGVGIARGYLNRPELTAEKFIGNPQSSEPGSRLYKTGDLARYLPDGNLEYLGRIDNQVKIRGFRIELGEIEAMLGQHPVLTENAVVVHETSTTDKRLIAYLVPHQGQVIENKDLRGFLKERLPDYMIPAAFVTLEALPLTPNGKVDRRALSQLSVNSYQLSIDDTFVAPRTPEEELLAGIWASVLGLEKVGIHDNFFELGGHSLLATQVMSRIRETFSCELPLRFLFESPTLAGLHERLRDARRFEPLPLITPVNRDGPLPLSFAQLRMWFLNQLEGASATYNMPTALRLDGQLHQPALEQSLHTLVQRHENLRTAFPTINGAPVVQLSVISDQLSVISLQHLLPSAIDVEVQRLINEDALRPFDLENGPLFRTMLLHTVQNQSYVLLLNMHHIISDGWSTGVLIRELSALYDAFKQGQPSPLPPLPIQYVDFAHWQQQWLTGDRFEQALNYWKQQLAGAPALLELPTDHPRPPILSYRGSTVELGLSAAVTESLKHLSQQANTTLFMTLLSAFATLLSRYSGQTDIVIGSPIANRTHPQIESLIGFFVNTLVLRLDLEGHPSFEALLGRVRSVALDAYAHQDIPFEQLVEKLQPERNLSYSPLFQVMLVLQNVPMGTLELPGLTLTPLDTENSIAKFDLTLSLEETAEGLVGALEYNTDLFERATIERIIGHFQTLSEGIVANPQQPIHKLPLLTEAERQQLMSWNHTAANYPRDKTVIDLFEMQVVKTPQNVAVVLEEQQLSYRELNSKANQVAHYLQTLGVKPDVLVGICVEPSIEMVIGLLGILKAGGAYLPLDPAYPAARLALMLEMAQVPVLLTLNKLVDTLPSQLAQVVCLDTNPDLLSRMSFANPTREVSPANLVYVIYTSGSTGKPKGAGVYHGGFVNLVNWFVTAFAMTQDDSNLVISSLSFDLTQKNIFAPLILGGRLHLLSSEYYDPRQIHQTVGAQKITWVNCTPSAFYPLIDDQEEWLNLASLRYVFLGGEPISVARLYTWLASVHCQAKLVNTYGPTECTDVCAAYQLDKPAQWLDKSVPIGQPIFNVKLLVLDQNLQRLPVGVIGELYIAGEGLGSGYLSDSELTQEKFRPNPYSDDPKARFYKTGDLARYLPDGNIDYLGRMDHQVKIRGFRIELGEIEAVLAQHSSVREVAVITREEQQGHLRLIAYLVSDSIPDRMPYQTNCIVQQNGKTLTLRTEDIGRGGVCLQGRTMTFSKAQEIGLRLQLPIESEVRWLKGTVAWKRASEVGIAFKLTPAEQEILDQSVKYLLENTGFLKVLQRTLTNNMRNYLKDQLPDYMIPSAFVPLAAIPLTPNGKIDRRALAQLSVDSERADDEAFLAPRTSEEKLLATIWAEVLGVERVGIHDNFFELGGHSLLATQVMSRVGDTFLVKLPLRLLFESPTIAGLSEHLSQARRGDTLPPILPVSRDAPLPLSFTQQEFWFFNQLDGGLTALDNMPAALRLEGGLYHDALEQSFQALVQRHENLRTCFPIVKGTPAVQISVISNPLSVINLQDLPPEEQDIEVQRLVNDDATRPFELSKVPLFRTTLLQLGVESHVLLLNMHHIIGDGWSWGILIRDLSILYEAFLQGKQNPLLPLPIQYVDFAHWQRQSLNGEVFDKQLKYWTQQLACAPALLELPIDHPRLPVQSTRGSSLFMSLSPALTAQLKKLSQQAGTTLFMTLLSVFATLFSRYSGQTDIVIGTLLANRAHTQLESLIGLFLSTLALRLNLEGNPPFDDVLQQTRRVTLEAYAHQDMPFMQLVETLRPDRNLSYLPLFQVMFDPQDVPMANLELPGLKIEFIVPEMSVATYELELVTEETDQGLVGTLVYNTDLFERATIERMSEHFQTLLEGIVENPQQPIRDLPLFTEGEEQQFRERCALSKLSVGNEPLSETLYVAPRTAEEELLAWIWAAALGVEKVGIHDNFFQLGGHSMLAAQVISRICEAFSVDMPLYRLFELQTIAELSEHLPANVQL